MRYRADFKQAADLVRAILHGGWTFDTPAWAGPTVQSIDYDECHGGNAADLVYSRAVWTAEAFIIYFELISPAFRAERFLKECGLSK